MSNRTHLAVHVQLYTLSSQPHTFNNQPYTFNKTLKNPIDTNLALIPIVKSQILRSKSVIKWYCNQLECRRSRIWIKPSMHTFISYKCQIHNGNTYTRHTKTDTDTGYLYHTQQHTSVQPHTSVRPYRRCTAVHTCAAAYTHQHTTTAKIHSNTLPRPIHENA